MKTRALRSSIPAGVIEHSGVEFFKVGSTPYAFYNRQILSYEEFPEWIKELVYKRILQKTHALESLVSWGFVTRDAQIKQFLLCTRSVLDNNPDINSRGKLQYEEYVPCDKRGGQCDFEGKICSMTIVLDNGERLTERQVQVTEKIGQDLPDKIICNDLGIKQNTLRTHKDDIKRKGLISSKSGIAVLAHQLKLI